MRYGVWPRLSLGSVVNAIHFTGMSLRGLDVLVNWGSTATMARSFGHHGNHNLPIFQDQGEGQATQGKRRNQGSR